MKWIRANIGVIILAVLVLLMATFIFTMLKGKERAGVSTQAISDAFREAIKAKDQTIDVLKKGNAELSSYIDEHEKIDSILLVKLISNQPKYAANDKKLKDVVTAVHDLNKDQLRREFAIHP